MRAAIASDAPPRYQRRPAGSIVDEVEPWIRELLRAYPTMPATVIAERVGWSRSIRVLSGRVAQLRPVSGGRPWSSWPPPTDVVDRSQRFGDGVLAALGPNVVRCGTQPLQERLTRCHHLY